MYNSSDRQLNSLYSMNHCDFHTSFTNKKPLIPKSDSMSVIQKVLQTKNIFGSAMQNSEHIVWDTVVKLNDINKILLIDDKNMAPSFYTGDQLIISRVDCTWWTAFKALKVHQLKGKIIFLNLTEESAK